MKNILQTGARYALCVSFVLLGGCGGGGGATTTTTTTQVTAPAINAAATPHTQNGAEMVTLATSTSGATIYYTIDGSTPTTSSIQYEGPFLVASNLTVNAIAVLSGETNSTVTTKSFALNIASGDLVWSDEFSNATGSDAGPDSTVWTYDTGAGGWGNSELEDYCAYGSSASPCSSASPNVFVTPGGGLNIVAEEPSAGVYTSSRMKTEGLFSFQYGRLEVKALLPEGQGMWPAIWMLGNNINTVSWPACGELDMMEHIDGSNPANEGYDWVQGSIHGTNLNGGIQYTTSGFSAAAWHTYGMIWSQGKIQYYVDSPTKIYATFTPSTQTGTWPFDSGPQFLIMNTAVGGYWPGNPDNTTTFPATMQVEYVRVYAN